LPVPRFYSVAALLQRLRSLLHYTRGLASALPVTLFFFWFASTKVQILTLVQKYKY
jgi:hypothetical protein